MPTDASPETVTRLDIGGMTCAACKGTVERAIQNVSGVQSAVVNLADGTARVISESQTEIDAIVTGVQRAGYQARVAETGSASGDDYLTEESRDTRRRFFIALALTLPVAMAMWFGRGGAVELWAQAVFAGLVQIGPGRAFYASALRALGHRTTNMDTLVALGSSAAYGYSLLSMLGWLGPESAVFFESSAFLITFLCLGKWLESTARRKARHALVALLDLAPARARVLIDGVEQEINARELKPGMRVVVHPSERIPADGVIRRGATTLDESMLTGESLPVEKGEWDDVFGGTLNRTARIEAEITASGEATVLAGIVRMVRDAQSQAAPIQRLADRVSSIFVPGVIVLAGVTLAVWYFGLDAPFVDAFTRGVAVLVIACPCALGLATPTAILVGSGMGLRHGILIKNGAALELLGRTQRLLLDKTGTLTRGEPRVTGFRVAPGLDEAELLEKIGAIEQSSHHPFAAAVIEVAKARGCLHAPALDVREHEGRGVEGTVDGVSVLLGRATTLEERGIALEPLPDTHLAVSRIAVAFDGKHAGDVFLADTLRPEAPEVVATFQRHGIEVVLVSGDRPGAVAEVARECGIERTHAQVLPADKQRLVETERRDGRVVAMVGDGINDAPALAAADVGIAIGSGTDVAKETGDLVLVRSELRDLVRAWHLARATLTRVKQNLGWAFGYNLAGIPIAAGILVPWGITLKPEYAGLAMALSSVSVVVSSLMLRTKEKRIFEG